MERRTFIAGTIAASVVVKAPPALATQGDGDGFDACLRVGLRDDLSAAARITGLLASGFQPVNQNEVGFAATLIGESLAMYHPRPLSAAPTTAQHIRANVANTMANVGRRSANGRTSTLVRADEASGPIYAYVLQAEPGAQISIAVACRSAQNVDRFLERYVSPIPPLGGAGGFIRQPFHDVSGSNVQARLSATRIDKNFIQSISSGFSAAGNLLITSKPV